MHILFLCTGNSCRSQMAEGWARHLAPQFAPTLNLQVSSAGLEAHGLNPSAVATMRAMGVDISAQTSDVLSKELLMQVDLVISVCSHADTHCPVLPAGILKQHIPFEDPAKANGNPTEIQAIFNTVCDQIKSEVQNLLQTLASKDA